MISLYPGQVVDPSSPALAFFAQVGGRMVTAASLAFAIFDASGAQVFPVSGTHAVDLANDVFGVGRYVARWTVPSNQAAGRYELRWTFALNNPSAAWTSPPPSGVCSKIFEVVAAPASIIPVAAMPRYALLVDVKDEAIFPAGTTDAKMLQVIARASAAIERVTMRSFEPKYFDLKLNGNSARIMQVGMPIVGVEKIGIDTQPTMQGDLTVELDNLRIYNRHLSGLKSPDDRDSPKVEFVHSDDLYGIRFVPFRGISLRSLAFPIGVQNVHIFGTFGYTEPDGSPWGETPLLIQHATKLIVAREAYKLGPADRDNREDAQQRWRITSEKARDIQVDMADPRKYGEWFGDPEIDSILVHFVRPPALGSV